MEEKADRAKQFMPFAALTGFYDLVEEREHISERRRERSDEENRILNERIHSLKKGLYVKIKYYLTDSYETVEGRVLCVDFVFLTLTVNNIRIPFDDIYEIEILYFLNQ